MSPGIQKWLKPHFCTHYTTPSTPHITIVILYTSTMLEMIGQASQDKHHLLSSDCGVDLKRDGKSAGPELSSIRVE